MRLMKSIAAVFLLIVGLVAQEGLSVHIGESGNNTFEASSCSDFILFKGVKKSVKDVFPKECASPEPILCPNNTALVNLGKIDTIHIDNSIVDGRRETPECIMRNLRCWNNLWIDGKLMPSKPCPK